MGWLARRLAPPGGAVRLGRAAHGQAPRRPHRVGRHPGSGRAPALAPQGSGPSLVLSARRAARPRPLGDHVRRVRRLPGGGLTAGAGGVSYWPSAGVLPTAGTTLGSRPRTPTGCWAPPRPTP